MKFGFYIAVILGVMTPSLLWAQEQRIPWGQNTVVADEQTAQSLFESVTPNVTEGASESSEAAPVLSFSQSVKKLASERTLETVVQNFAPENPKVFMPMAGLMGTHGSLAWTHFFSSALSFEACLKASHAYAAFYNPVSDIFVVMHYRQNVPARDPSFLQAVMVTRGEKMRGEEVSGDQALLKMPPWFLAEAKGLALREKTLGALQGFQKMAEANCDRAPLLWQDDEAGVLARLDFMITSVRDLKHGNALALSGHDAIVQLMNFGNVRPYQSLTTKTVKDPLILAYRAKKPESRVDLASAFLPAAAAEDKEPAFLVHYELGQPGVYLLSRFWYDAVTQQKYMVTERIRLLP
jgi:hypothetical protein